MMETGLHVTGQSPCYRVSDCGLWTRIYY